MPAVRKAYKKKYKVDLVEEIKEFSYPTTKCLMELAAKVPPSKKVGGCYFKSTVAAVKLALQ